MKPPFDSSGGDTPAPASELTKPSGLSKSLPGTPALPGMPDLPAIPDLPDLPELPCLPGSCDALWNAVDKGLSPFKDAADKAMSTVGDAAKAASDAKDKALKAAEEQKDKAAKVAEEAKDKAVKAAEEAKEKAQKTVDEAKAKATKALEDAKAAVREKMGEAAAYAQQFLGDPALAWSGLQAVAARQAACAMEKATEQVEKAKQAVHDAADTARQAAGKVADDAAAFAKARADDARKAADGVVDSGKKAGDTALETIAPVTQFYKDNGLDKLGECGSVPGRPEVPAALFDALEQVSKGTAEAIRAGTDMISQFEQNQVMEQAIYDAERYASEYGSMADKAASGLTDAIPTEFPMSSTCGGAPSPFDGSMLDPDARSRYLNQMMDEFERKGKDEAEKMMTDIIKQVPAPPGVSGMPTPGAGKGFGL